MTSVDRPASLWASGFASVLQGWFQVQCQPAVSGAGDCGTRALQSLLWLSASFSWMLWCPSTRLPDFTDLKCPGNLHTPLRLVSCCFGEWQRAREALPRAARCACALWGLGGIGPHSLMWLFRSACSDRDFILFVCLFSDGPICRICHEGGNGEGLLSPCDCTGTLGTVHKSCLEKWLSSSNTSYCELCHTEFVVERRPRPLTEVPLSSCFTFISLPFERK